MDGESRTSLRLKRRRRLELATVALFFLIVSAPVALWKIQAPGLAAVPSDPSSEFPRRLRVDSLRHVTSWFADSIGLRNALVRIGSGFHVGILHRSTNQKVVIGGEGWLFYTDIADQQPADMRDFRGKARLSQTEIDAVNANVGGFLAALDRCGIKFLLVVAPNKQTVYGEYLSGNDSFEQRRTRLDDLKDRLDPRISRSFLELRTALRAARPRHAPIPLYYKTDTHWNALGAFTGYQEIMQRIGPEIGLARGARNGLDSYDVVVTRGYDGDIATRLLSSPGLFEDIDVRLLPKGRPARWPGGYPHDEPVISDNPDGARRVVLLHDSFGIALLPFLADEFRRVGATSRRDQIQDLIMRTGPDAVILEVVERYLDLRHWRLPQQLSCAPPRDDHGRER